MRGEDRLPEIRALAEGGVSNAEIGRRLGLATANVWRLRHPERWREIQRRTNVNRAAAKREWERDPANKVPCVTCGGPTAGTPGQLRRTRRDEGKRECQSCWLAAEEARVAERAHRIEAWWAEGLSLREIAARLDWSIGHLGKEMNRLRRKGFDLPHRYRTYGGKRVAA